jgi:hypothetical protein
MGISASYNCTVLSAAHLILVITVAVTYHEEGITNKKKPGNFKYPPVTPYKTTRPLSNL